MLPELLRVRLMPGPALGPAWAPQQGWGRWMCARWDGTPGTGHHMDLAVLGQGCGMQAELWGGITSALP